MPLGDRRDSGRHRRGKQRRLTRLGRGVHQRLEVFGEAHVEHFVGFVEHEHFERVERQRLAAQMVERAAGRGDDDVGAALERADLLTHWRAAEDRHDGQCAAFGVFVERFRDLHRQLARGHEDEAANRTARARRPGDEMVQHR
jgi:hypothetical protein